MSRGHEKTLKRGILSSEIQKVISYCPVDPVFVAEMVDGKLVLILDDPIFEYLGQEIWDLGVKLGE
jgi:hypothetical protein